MTMTMTMTKAYERVLYSTSDSPIRRERTMENKRNNIKQESIANTNFFSFRKKFFSYSSNKLAIDHSNRSDQFKIIK